MKKIFIFGIGGLLGYRTALLAKNEFEVCGSYNFRNPQLDFVDARKTNITNHDEVKEILTDVKPDYVINAAALSNVDYCESHREEAKLTNIDAVEGIFNACNELRCKLLHISSDSVFDGLKDGPYTENDKPNPINNYGKTKLESEKIILANANHLVVRASVLYGWLPEHIAKINSSSMKNYNFAQWLIQNLKAKKTAKIITDEISSPILADELARSSLHLIRGEYRGLYHSAPPIQISRYDFSVRIANHFGLDKDLIHPIMNKELGRNVKTGKNKCLSSTKIQTETKFQFFTLDQSLSILKKQSIE